MLVKPDKGFIPSANVHRSNNSIVCDWIEASIIFDDGSLSKFEIADTLIDLMVYSDSNPDFALEYVDNLFGELDFRKESMGDSYPFYRDGNIIKAKDNWNKFIEYTFCLLISLLPNYDSWRKTFDPDYGWQGDLFEVITVFCLEKILPEWEIRRYGWSRDHATPLGELLPKISRLLCEKRGDSDYWAGKHANDAGLDVLCVRTFPDQRSGFFSLLVQCASGANWIDKLRDPNLSKWGKYIDFACKPYKGISIPYILDKVKYRRKVNESEGLLFDRLRLFSNGVNPIGKEIAGALEDYLQKAIKSCPTM